MACTIGSAWKRSSITSIEQDIRERHQTHALMVRHISTDNGHILTLGHPAGRVIQRFIVTIGSPAAGVQQGARNFGWQLEDQSSPRAPWRTAR